MSEVFAYGVASGDPTADAVVIWTRVRGPATVRWWVEGMGEGETEATLENDFTVSVDVGDLAAGTTYRYGFEALGERSPVGITQTLPDREHVRFAQVSCAKFNAGYFNAYARIAARADLDFVLHLGDYIYEASQTPPKSQTPGADIGRPFDPLHECKTLADYRTRYAHYRSDPDVQALHAAHPLIATLDDHELADGAWRDGAAEHVPERDGPWAERRAAALRARREWLPVRLADPERVFRTVSLGDLANLFLLDTRSRRDQPAPPPASADPRRSALGGEQREWLERDLRSSTAAWRLVGNPSVMSRTWDDALPKAVRDALVKVKLIDVDGTGPDYDQWDGYPAEREWLLSLFEQLDDVVVLSGDVHVGMAFELPGAVEFVNASLTSQNLDDKMGWGYRDGSLAIEEQLVSGMEHLRWCDLDSHGYSVVDVTPARVRVEWWALETVLERSAREELSATWEVRRGEPRVVPG